MTVVPSSIILLLECYRHVALVYLYNVLLVELTDINDHGAKQWEIREILVVEKILCYSYLSFCTEYFKYIQVRVSLLLFLYLFSKEMKAYEVCLEFVEDELWHYTLYIILSSFFNQAEDIK